MTRSIFSVFALVALLSAPLSQAGESSGGLPTAILPADVSFQCEAFQVVYNWTKQDRFYAKYKSLPFTLQAKKGGRMAGIGASISHGFTREEWIRIEGDPKDEVGAPATKAANS